MYGKLHDTVTVDVAETHDPPCRYSGGFPLFGY